MIITTVVHCCPSCGSTNIVKNGHTGYGSQRCLCRDCKKTRVLVPVIKTKDEPQMQQAIERSLRERCSLRGIARIFKISVETLLLLVASLVKELPALRESVIEAREGDILELDELCSFVGKKSEKRWIWIALCRRTRQVVAFFIGDRSEKIGPPMRLPQTFSKNPTFLSSVCIVQRLLEGLSKGFPDRKTSVGRQRERANQSCRTVELHPQTTS
jgi:transposase-like protein/IS1 family transposase